MKINFSPSLRHRSTDLIITPIAPDSLDPLAYDFLNTITHEFKTPLASILGYSELIDIDASGNQFQEQLIYLRRIQAKVRHMTQMLDDLMTIEESQSGLVKFTPQRLDLSKFCQSLIEDFQRSLDSDREIISIVPDRFPELYLDRKLLHNILGNLLSNAIKYSPPQSPASLTIEIDTKLNQLSLRVRDWGIGIPPEQQPYLFNSFYRASNVGKIPGTGLGLAIVQNSVFLHGGEIFVQSELNVGTSFTVILPAIECEVLNMEN